MASTAERCSSVRSLGTVTSMRTSRSPALAPLLAPAGTPRPFTRRWVPGEVPGRDPQGHRLVEGGHGDRRPESGLGEGDRHGEGEVAAAPAEPGVPAHPDHHVEVARRGPSPGRARPAPSPGCAGRPRRPAGIRTFTFFTRRSVPVPWQVGHGVSTVVPRPLHTGQMVESENSPWLSSRVPRPPQRSQVWLEVPGAAPLPPQVWQRPSSAMLTVVVTPRTASSKARCTSVSTSAPRSGLPGASPAAPTAPEEAAEQVAQVAHVLHPEGAAAGEAAGLRRRRRPSGPGGAPRRTPCAWPGHPGRRRPRRSP